jgi:hypothetical protein
VEGGREGGGEDEKGLYVCWRQERQKGINEKERRGEGKAFWGEGAYALAVFLVWFLADLL